MTIYKMPWRRIALTLTHPRPYVEKAKRELWSPTVFNEKRSIKTAIETCILVFDLDGGSKIQETEEALKKENVAYLLHTTASHTEEDHKYRVIMPIFSPVPAKLWKHYYSQALNWWNRTIQSPTDPACKDVSRAYYLSYGGPNYYSSIQDGNWLDFIEEATLDYNHEQTEIHNKEAEAKLEQKKRENYYNNRQKAHPSHTDWYKYIYNLLKTCKEERSQLGSRIGGIERDGKISGFICPVCNRRDATFYYVKPTIYSNAYCLHKNSCGTKGIITSYSLWQLAKYNNFI